MKDLHSHILYGIDDGSKDITSSIELIKNAYLNGVTDIMLTPHYVYESKYTSNYENNLKILNELKENVKDIDVNLYLGNEVYINYNLLELYKNKEITTLNNSRYMLIELPLTTKFNDAKSIFFDLINNGIIPILAHPERYTEYYKNIEFFLELRQRGVLMQTNYVSIVGLYGRKAKKMAKMLLKANLISFVGSDAHHINEEKYDVIEKSMKKIKKIVGEEKLEEITKINFDKVIRNADIN